MPYMNKEKIILLDLNYTLAYREDKQSTVFFYHRIDEELYRKELIQKIREFTIVLITARPFRYRKQTLENIKKLTGLVPDMALFNEWPYLKAPRVKEKFLFRDVFLTYGEKRENYLALESNVTYQKYV